MKEGFKPQPAPPVKGWVKVQLFDAATGELKHEQEGANYLTPIIYSIFKKMQIEQVMMNQPGRYTHPLNEYGIAINNASWMTLYNNIGSGPFRYLFLTDYDSIEQPESEQRIKGEFLANADARLPSTSALTYIGTINVVESQANTDPTKVVLVFDFATDKANGTFRSLYFTNTNYANTAAYLADVGRRKRNFAIIINHPNTIYGAHGPVGGYIYFTTIAGDNHLMRMNISTKVVEPVATSPAPVQTYTCVVVGARIFCSSTNNATLYAYNTTNDTWETYANGSLPVFAGPPMYYYDGWLYSISTTQVRRFDTVGLSTNQLWTVDAADRGNNNMTNIHVDASGITIWTEFNKYYPDAWEGNMGLPVDSIGCSTGAILWDDKRGAFDTETIVTFPYLFTWDLSIETATCGSRKRLPADVTKTDSEVMKITYTFEVPEPI